MPKIYLPKTFPRFKQRPRSACGVGLIVNLGKSDHQLVRDGVEGLSRFEYRSGLNPVTHESDGSGLRFFGLPVDFYNHKINIGEFQSPKGSTLIDVTLSPKQFIIGRYFLPTNQISQAKALIERSVANAGLVVVAWRDMDTSVNLDVLSRMAREKKPSIWEAILMDAPRQRPAEMQTTVAIDEKTALTASFKIYHDARAQGIPIDIVSQSSDSVVYKGMIRPKHMGDFYQDLSNQNFTASAVGFHGRFATNTNPQWRNAQPCIFFGMHNGEFNSVGTNASDMSSELEAKQFSGIHPDKSLSDSMQFDVDVANQILMKNISFPEAVIRLFSPKPSEQNSEDERAMLRVFARERIPYNGPAFWVGGFGDGFIAALDQMGLRPSRWALIETEKGQQFHAASDDYLSHHNDGQKIIQKGHLEPGGMIMITPQGDILKTAEILKLVHKRYGESNPRWFQHQLESLSGPAHWIETHQKSQPPRSIIALNQHLYSAGWDYESEEYGVRYMANHGHERLGAMGDDTNPLHTAGKPLHISYFFHQLFAQVSAPSLDSIKERDRFSLSITLGAMVGSVDNPKQMDLASPILTPQAMNRLISNPWINPHVLDLSFAIPTDCSLEQYTRLLNQAIKQLALDAQQLVLSQGSGVIILSDRHAGAERGFVPDLIAIAAVRRHLEQTRLIRRVSLIMDSYQISGPHQAAMLLAMGAKAIYPRGGYEKIEQLFAENVEQSINNYQKALDKCLLKTMGKVGITDVNNYINGHLIAALGLDLSSDLLSNHDEPSLAWIFQGIYSPLKGLKLAHIAANLFLRHQQAYKQAHDFVLLPRSGSYMPEKDGIPHGYGPAVVNAFTDWLKAEDLRAKVWQMDLILERKGYPGFVSDRSLFSPEQGFLDPRKKDEGPLPGIYPPDYLETIQPGPGFRKMLRLIEEYSHANPTTLRDYFQIVIDEKRLPVRANALEKQASIRARLFSGSMSQGALTVTNPDNPELIGAHETLTRGMNAIGAMSASGEGGEDPGDLRSYLLSTRSKQIASGRFGVSARQIVESIEMEIKIGQGAKPGEGGELPGTKVSVRFAAQRGGLPGLNFISPPPHHDIYSIEDLDQLIYDIKSVAPGVKVAVKLVASEGIDTIAVGVVKAGADIINIAGNSGGTAAAQQSSIKHTGMPAELALVSINRALIQSGLRDLVQLRVSGGFKTARDVIIAAILGADLFEFGTTAMLTLGCKMQRTCNHSCQPGVATDGHLFKGDQLNTERYFVNLAAAIQELLELLAVEDLSQLRGRVDLLQRSVAPLDSCFDLSILLQKNQRPSWIDNHSILQALERRTAKMTTRQLEDQLASVIEQKFAENPMANIVLPPIVLDTTVRSFGARLAGRFVEHLEKYPGSHIQLNTSGPAGQSFGFVLPPGLSITHQGSVLDGCVKSMTGGIFVLKTPFESQKYRGDHNSGGGNVMAFGATGGKIFVNAIVGHRLGVLLKGAEIVVEGAGDLAFEYMTSGTGMILGQAGPGLCNSAMGGIVFVYDPHHSINYSEDVRPANPEELAGYETAIIGLLRDHLAATDSIKAREVLATFDINHFKVLIPKSLDLINTPRALIDVLKTYKLRQSPLTCGMQAWLQQQIHTLFNPGTLSKLTLENRLALRQCVQYKPIKALFSEFLLKKLFERHPTTAVKSPPPSLLEVRPKAPKHESTVTQRLSNIEGGLDEVFDDALLHINRYVSALNIDAQGCSGCRAQSCAGGDNVETGCPSGKSINTINSLLKRLQSLEPGIELNLEQWRALRQAFEVQIEASPFIAYTGAACPAPCEDACTESIPTRGDANQLRGGKPVGEPVHIKNIEYYLFQIGRSLGWFDGTKTDVSSRFEHYEQAMQGFKPAFRQRRRPHQGDKQLIIIGSGPAGMQLAFDALREGIKVRMYEKSSTPGGLLADGIPAHKFNKRYIEEDFLRLKALGLELHLNSDIVFHPRLREYTIQNDPMRKIIASLHNESQVVALCVGSGSPKNLPIQVTKNLGIKQKQCIIQAVDFLKAANKIAQVLADNPSMTADAREDLITQHFQSMDPRGKKIVVVGGGDTAQDVIRWVARYFNQSHHSLSRGLNILVRGTKNQERGLLDAYPSPSQAPTKENTLCKEEVQYIQGKTNHLIEVSSITAQTDDRLTLHVKQYEFKYHNVIRSYPDLRQLARGLPREARPLDHEKTSHHTIANVDMVICALGFSDPAKIPIVADSMSDRPHHIMVAGDASGSEANIIVGAQANARKTWLQNKDLLVAPNPIPKLSGPFTLFDAKKNMKAEIIKDTEPKNSLSSTTQSLPR